MRYELNFEVPFAVNAEFEQDGENFDLEDPGQIYVAQEELAEEFRPSALPPKVKEAYNLGALGWMLAVQRAIELRITDLDFLTNMVFFMHHPERIQAGKGKALDPSEPQFAKLSNEWKAFRTLIQPLLKSPGSGSSKPSSSTPNLVEMLKKVPIDSLTRSPAERLRLQQVQIFLARALSGERVDDSYWQFTILDGFGRERPCSFIGTIAGVKPSTRPQHALANFKRNCATARSVQEVGRCLKNVHDAVLCHTNALLGWARHNQALGDAALRDFSECAWLLELQAASVRVAPKSIYSCFAQLLRNVHKVCT